MKKLLLASAFALMPFVAFAGGDQGGMIAGNITGTASISVGGLAASQGTQAGAVTAGNGGALESATAGNGAAIDTNGYAKAGPGYAKTGSNTTEMQGGNTTVVEKTGAFWGVAAGGADAKQGSTVVGGSGAAAGNLNGFVAVQQSNHR